MRSAAADLNTYDPRPPRLERSLAGRILRTWGVLLLACGALLLIATVTAFVRGSAQVLHGLILGTALGLYLAAGLLFTGTLLLGFAQLADAILTAARCAQRVELQLASAGRPPPAASRPPSRAPRTTAAPAAPSPAG